MTDGGGPRPGHEIRLNEDGTLDEVLGWGWMHLEQMADNAWSLILDTEDGTRLMIPIFSKRARVSAFAEVDGPSDLWRRRFARREED